MRRVKTVSKQMVVIVTIGIIVGFGFQMATASKDSAAAVRMIPENFSKLAKAVRPGVVNIRTVKTRKDGGPVFRHFFGNPFGDEAVPNPFSRRNPQNDSKQQSLGSGFVIDRKGYIVTNNHVIDGADEIKVKLYNGETFDATVVGQDSKTDLALIKVKASDDLTPLKLGNSGTLEVGTWVVAVGSPFGLEQTVTAGIVSGKGRVIGAGPYDDFIQTDASINPGNSGGPLLNMKGEVVGINTAIVARGQGIGFAIPVDMAQGIVDQLRAEGKVTRAWLGVAIQDLTPEIKQYYGIKNQDGVFVSDVYQGDPAEKGGIRPSDVITAVNGKAVATTRELSRTIAESPVEKKIPITVLRDGRKKTVRVALARRTDSRLMSKVEKSHSDELGMKLSEMNPDAARRLGFSDKEKGVLVTHVKPGSKADRAGIHRGDLVKEINHKKVDTVGEYEKAVAKANTDNPVKLLIKRPNVGYLAVVIA